MDIGNSTLAKQRWRTLLVQSDDAKWQAVAAEAPFAVQGMKGFVSGRG